MSIFNSERVSDHLTRIIAPCGVCMYLVQGRERAALLDTGFGFGDLKGYVESMTNTPYVVLLSPLNFTGSTASRPAPRCNMIFNKDIYSVEEITLFGQSVRCRAWRDIPYVDRPLIPEFQRLNLFAPEALFAGESVNGYTLTTAPVFVPNTVGGYMPGAADEPREDRRRPGQANTIFQALRHGYVVAAPAIRGRSQAGGQAVNHNGLLDRFKKNSAAPEPVKAVEWPVTVFACAKGRALKMEEIPDPVFSEGVLGQCCGIEPVEGKIYAPVDGKVTQVADSKHALGFVGPGEVEILVHVGVDTVDMNGDGFQPRGEVGDAVTKG